MMNEKQNGISLMELLILVVMVSCRALAGVLGKPRNVGTGFTRLTARALFHPALILVILCSSTFYDR